MTNDTYYKFTVRFNFVECPQKIVVLSFTL